MINLLDPKQNIPEVENVLSEAKERGQVYRDSFLETAYRYQNAEAQENAKQATLITSILENYKDQQSKRNKNKYSKQKTIFWVLMVLVCGLTIALALWIGFLFCFHQTIATPEIIGLITSCITYLSSLLIIFFVIVKYVFPEDEEKDFNELVAIIIKNHTDRLNKEYEYLMKRDEKK